MSVLVVGLSHSSAPVPLLERVVVSGDALAKLLQDVHLSENVAGSFVLSTCNRVEVYAEVDRFHGGVAAICELLARHSGVRIDELTGSAYVHYEDRAVQHLLAVTCGLESMVIGESQILGQVRQAVRLARQHRTLSRELADLGALALRTGKRAHAETSIDAAGQSLVSLGLARAASELSRQAGTAAPLHGLSVLVVGAGSMSSLVAATSMRQGVGRLVIANRTRRAAELLAARFGAITVSLSELPSEIADADIVVACTGAPVHVISAATVAHALELRRAGRVGGGRASRPAGSTQPLVLLDLALPRDVEPRAGLLAGASLIDLAAIGAAAPAAASAAAVAASGSDDERAPAADLPSGTDVAAVRRIVAQELAGYLQADRAARVAPTVVALRAKAATVVESEIARLERRLGDLDVRSRREIAQSMGRIADKLLHGPTVRVKELAGSPGADSYETALRVLFELDPDTVQAVTRPEDMLSDRAAGESAPGQPATNDLEAGA
jgi:glutamyl-tRNA reductase